MLGKPSRRTRKRLEEAGKKANATVVEVAEKGMSVTKGTEGVIGNTELALKTTLKVQPEGEPEFEVKTTFRYPQLSVPAAGQALAVIYDPEDHDKIMLDDSPEAQQSAALAGAGIDAGAIGDAVANAQKMQQQAMQGGGAGMTFGAPAAADPVAQLEKLQALKEKGALSDSEFEAQKAKILGQ
ncbi:MAG: SHOCT domain-containing protein [Solirubrobacterales bacterium]